MKNDKSTREFRKQFNKYAKNADSILITAHNNPDPDAITSSLALYEILSKKYPKKMIRVAFSSDLSDKWGSFKDFNVIESGTDIAEKLTKFDLAVFLDGKWYYRFSAKPEEVGKNKITKVCIDHHKGESDKFDLFLIKPNSTSTSELIYRVFLEDEKKISKTLCEKILLGILNDTGFFRFVDHKKSYIFPIIERLVDEGNINIDLLNYDYEGYPLRMFEIIQELVKNTTVKKIDGWPNLLSSYVSRNFIEKGKYSEIEVDEAGAIYIAAFGRAIFNVPWAVMTYPTEDGNVYIRLRSKPKSVNARLVMEEMGIGGGHDDASGGLFVDSQKTLNVVSYLEKFFEWLSKNNPKKFLMG